MEEPFEDGGGSLAVTIGEDAPARLDKALAAAVPEDAALSRSRLMRMIAEGAVFRDGLAVTDPKAKVVEGEVYTLRLDPAVEVATLPEDIPLSVVWEDADLIVIDKPAGMVVHPAPGSPSGTLVNALLHHCGDTLSGIGGERRPGIVHRIDKDTSGLLVVAKTDKAHEGLAAQFADHSIERAYLAIVIGLPKPLSGTVRGNIGRSPTNRKKMALVEDERGKHAVTHYKTLETFDGASLVECRLETGRTHQVRVHLAASGHALLGDPVYGRTHQRHHALLTQLHFNRQALHAAVLGFIHPITGAAVRFESTLPADMAGLLVELGNKS
jgi:23S rRNA pseudouridine1911/1915/1917 synthase